jgi:hypothetical protein
MAKLGYALPSTIFSESQCNRISKKLVSATLQKLGVNKNFPRDLAFAPVEIQGLGITTLYIKQGTEILFRVCKFMINDSSLTGHLMHTSFQYLQLELGHSNNVFQLNFPRWGFLATHGYLKKCWEFCHRFAIEFQPEVKIIPPRREFDQTIMFIISQFCSGQLLKEMNRCRIRLQLMWVSDLATGDGTTIREDIRKGIKDTNNKSNYLWLQQGDLHPTVWKEWDRILRELLGFPQSKGRIQLRNKLGRWLDRDYCDWFICKDSDRLYQKSTSKVFACIHKSKTRSGSKYMLINSEEPIPETSEGTTVFLQGNTFTTEGCRPWIRPEAETYTSFQDFMRKQKQWTWLQPSIIIPSDDCHALAEAIQQGTYIAVSDGSFKDARGTASIVIKGQDGRFRLRCDVVVLGDEGAQSAYRSELTGIMTAVNLIDLICIYFKITTGTVTMVCDGKSALERFFGTPSTYSFGKHFDLIIPTQQLLKNTKVSWRKHHVLGHQVGDSLDSFALLNCEMDEACKAYWQVTENQRIQGHCNSWKVIVNGKFITSDLQKTVYKACASQMGYTYWEKKLDQPHGMIDWSSTASAMSEITKTRQQWVLKHSSGFCGVGKMMYRMKKWPSPACPRCGLEEDTEHVWICQHSDVQQM